MKQLKKTLAILLCAGLMCGLTGCGNSGDAADNGTVNDGTIDDAGGLFCALFSHNPGILKNKGETGR